MCGICEALVAITESTSLASSQEFSVTISDRNDNGRWLWVVRDVKQGINKGAGCCATAQEAIKTGFHAAAFACQVAMQQLTAAEVELLGGG